MAKFTLAAGQQISEKMQYDWLIYRSGEGDIEISAPSMDPTKLEVGDVINVADVDVLRIKNLLGESQDIELQNSPREIITNNTKQVRIVGGFLDTIQQPFQVEANATVNNGTVTSQSPNALGDVADITISAGAKVQVLGTTTKARRVVTLQNISATQTTLRVGGATVAAGRGAVLRGSNDAIASAEFETTGAVYVHNQSATAATVAVMWGDR